jgi:hypothetical protein
MMASLLYPDEEQAQMQAPQGGPLSLLQPSDDRPPALRPDPRADALGETYRAISEAMVGQRNPEIVYGRRLAHYPDAADVANARQSDFGYGSGNEAYMAGRVANLLDVPTWSDDRALTASASGRASAGTPETARGYEAAQLAINRSPIAALGYDPRAINLDVASGPEASVVGAYSPETNGIVSNAAYPSNLVHESIHRGLEALRRAGVVPPEVWAKLPADEEKTTRYIMALHMGDPERGRGPAADADRARALRAFGKREDDPQAHTPDPYAGESRQALEDLNKIASRYLFSLHPGGPR